MSANRALIECLENYLEDIVLCFEQFVRKTLLVISIAAGLLMAVLMYFLKKMQRQCITAAPCRRVPKCKRITPGSESLNGLCKKTSSCCLKLKKCPSSATKTCARKLSCSLPCPPYSCSRRSSCESLFSRNLCSNSDTSICSKKPCSSKATCSFCPSCLSFSPAPCKRTCPPPSGICSSSPSKILIWPQRCNRPCFQNKCSNRRATIPSLISCKPPPFRLGLPSWTTINPVAVDCSSKSKSCIKSKLNDSDSCYSLCD